MARIPFCFVIFIVAVAKFKDTAYSVVEGDRSFMVVIEKEGETANDLNLVIDFIQGSATGKEYYRLIFCVHYFCKHFNPMMYAKIFVGLVEKHEV